MNCRAFCPLSGKAAVCAVIALAILQLSSVFAHAQFRLVGTIVKPLDMIESSGLAASKKYPDVIWTHGDGSSRHLFAMRPNGTYIRSFPVGATFVDWEDILADDSGNLYLADTGSDGAARSHVKIHRVREPDPLKAKNVLVERTWHVRFPGTRKNSEAFFILDGKGYLITKEELGGSVTIYGFELSNRAESILLERVTTVEVPGVVTAAAISSDSARLALLTDDGPVVYMINGNVEAIRSSVAYFRPFPANTLIEGATFKGDGLLISSEVGELFLFTDPQFQTR